MEQEADVECGSSTPSAGIGKSKLDNLSKEDLIKYAKKQMAAMQKLKLKCSDLETQVGALKIPPRENANDSIIQELTERMDAVLLEKAETQQSLVVLRKENEKLKKQAEESLENLAALQEKLNNAYRDHNEKMKAMEKEFKASEARHKEELEILKNAESKKYENEKTQRLRLIEEFDSNIEAVRLEYQKKVSDLEQNLKSDRTEWTAETEALKQSHQTSLKKAQEELENLQTEVARLCRQHEEEVKDLEEQLEINATNFDMERERLLLLQDELSEQIALKEGYLQDVQEEEEDLNRGGAQKASGTIKLSETSGLEDPDNDIDRLRLALLDLQSQNTMLQEELTFLSNVKTELEIDLKHIREEFSMEREDLEFKINELQMTKDDGDVYSKEEAHANLTDTIQLDRHNQILKELKEQHNAEIKELETILTTRAEQEKEVVVQELKDLQNMYKIISEEKHAIISEYEHTKAILHNLESELGERTSDFVRKYNAMKDQAARSIQELQEKLSDKDTLIDQLKSSEQTPDRLEQTSEIPQKLKDSSVALEDALKEKESLSSCVADLEAKLSSSLAEKDQLGQKCNSLEENLAALQKLDKKSQENDQLQEALHSALQDKDSLINDLENSKKELSDIRQHICEILEQKFPESTVEEDKEISQLLNHLLKAQEEKMVGSMSVEENGKLQKDLNALLEENEAQKKKLQTLEGKLLDVQKHISKILEVECSQNLAEEQDVSSMLTCLQSRIHEAKASYVVSSEENVKQWNNLVTVVEERDELKKDMEISKEKLLDFQRQVHKILEQEYSENIAEEQDISALLTHLQSRIHEAKESYMVSNEEIGKQQSELVTVVEERDELKKQMETTEEKLLDVQKNINKILEQEFSENIGEEQDISAMLTCLQSRIHEAKASYVVSSEENVKQQNDLVTVVEERDELKKDMEISKGKLLDCQRQVHKILEQEYSENIAEEQDISALLTHLQSRIHEAKESYMVSNEEIGKQQSELVTVVKERDEFKKEMEISKKILLDAQKHINKILEQEYSENIAEEQDISALLTHLQYRIHEAKASYMESSEENVKQQKDLVTVVEERDELKKDMEICKEKLLDFQKQVHKILEQEYSENIAEEQDISALLTHLQSRIHEAKESYMVPNEEIGKQQSELVTVVEERDELKKQMETTEKKLLDVQKNINKILEQEYSENIAEEQDISAVLTHLQSRIHEAKASSMVSNEKNVKQQSELVKGLEERDEFKKEMEISKEKLINVQKHVNKILEQEYSENISEEQDISAMLTCLQSRIHDAKASYLVSHEEIGKQQSELVTVVEERDELKKDMEISKGKLFDFQRQVYRILEQEYSENIAEEQDISAVLTCLQSRIHEAKASYIESSEGNVKQQKDFLTVVEERDELKKQMETTEEKLLDVQKNINKILEQEYSENIAEEQDISAMLTHLQSRIHEAKASYMVSNEEIGKQQSELVTVVEERDELKKDMEICKEKLLDFQKQVHKILEQEYSENIAEEQDVVALLTHLQSRIHEAKASYMESSEENRKQQEDQIDGLKTLSNAECDAKSQNVHPKSENKQQHSQVAEIADRPVHEGIEEPSDEAGTQETDDMKRLQQKLCEKESIIAHLKEEISHLQESKMPALSENTKQIEILQKEIKEKDERLNKIKAVAVKARKELDNSKKEASALKEELEALKGERDKMSESMKDIIHGAEDYKNLMIDYDKQTELLDKEKEKLEAAERLITDLNKRLQAAVEQQKQLSSEREDLMARIDTLQTNARLLEAQALDMRKLKSAMEKDLEAERLLKEQKTKDHGSVVKELEELQSLLHKQKQELQQTEHELEQLRKDAQQSTLLDMEMADYERLVKELNQQLSEKDRLLEEQESQAHAQKEKEEKLKQKIESLKSLVDTREEKASKMKQLLVKTKKDLADAKKEEASQAIIQSSLKEELEANQQQLENYKIQCSELTADKHRLQEQLRLLSDQHQKTVTSFQHQVAALQKDLSSSKAELESTMSEFDGYKVRVHNVLKQQKTRSSANGDGELSKQEREHMESMLEQLRSKLKESQLNVQSCNAELQQLQSEHDTLLERHNKMLQQTVAKEAELRERLLALHSENVNLKSEHSQSVAQLNTQTESLRSSFREQVHHLQDEHRSTVETLQHQINRLESQLFQLQKEPAATTPLQQSRKPQLEKKLADLPLFELNMAREEGEGMETTENESVSTAGTPPPSLEQLLTSPDPKNEPFVWQVEPTKDELVQKLNTATRSMDHVNSLLHESEATNAILMEQISVLKSELRRLERNQEREKSGANLEYLKNVLLQFILLRAGSEKQALLPVIHTMLQLSPEEKNKLAAVAQGEEEAAVARGSGWTSYLHSWSGIR